MELSANWQKLKASLGAGAPTIQFPNLPERAPSCSKRKQPPTSTHSSGKKLRVNEPGMESEVIKEQINSGLCENVEIGKYVAIDCEMVGVGPEPVRESALARVSIVNFNGEQVYDSFVRPKEFVTDWRTAVSGVSAKHMQDARSLGQVQADVARILDGNVLVGHAVRNDLNALLLSHPKRDIRDTARHPPFRKFAGGGSPKLKILAAEILGIDIQSGAHSSIEDAKATMLLFRKEKEAFDREHARKWPFQGGSYSKKTRGQKKKKRQKKKKNKQ